jgi:O-succinylbenzoic acid--CoA ligase
METTPPFDLSELKRDWIEGVSGRSFNQRVRRRITQIRAKGLAAHTRGVMILERDPVAFSAAFFAACYLRMPIILGNRRWQRREWEEVMALVNPAVIFGNAPFTERKRPRFEKNPNPSTILIPTGGSSGGVKFAVHRWETLSAACEGLHAFLGAGPIDSCCVLPLFHVSGLMQLMRSFLSKGSIAFPDFKELQLGQFPGFKSGTLCLSLVPTQLQRLMTQKRVANRLLLARAIFIGGAPIPGTVAKRARALKLPIVLTYGMTETGAMVATLPPDEFLVDECNVARPLKHVKIDILTDQGALCKKGKSGRIRIKSRALFKGYHGCSPLDLHEGYLTDDEGYIGRGGRLHVLGRRDRLIISGGEKIDPKEVEAAIMETGSVEQVLAMGWPDDEWGQKLVAFYVVSGVVTNERKWEEELRADLANYKVPKLIIQVPILPLDDKGKVDRKLMASLIANNLK